MLVCHCKGLTDRDVRRAIQAGACTHHAVTRECGAGSVCGGCRPLIDELLDAPRGASSVAHFELAFTG